MDRPLFMVSEAPKQSPEIVAAIDSINRETLRALGVPTEVVHSMVPAIRGNTTFFSFQNPANIILQELDGKLISPLI